MVRILLQLCALFIYSLSAIAETDLGVGKVAENLLEPVSVFSDFVDTACIVIGGSFIFASVVKYFEYRRSPMMVSLGTAVFLLIAGIILLFLPMLAFVTGNANLMP